MHGAGKGETRRRGVFLTVVDGNDLKADLMGQPARGKGNVPAAAEYDDALMGSAARYRTRLPSRSMQAALLLLTCARTGAGRAEASVWKLR